MAADKNEQIKSFPFPLSFSLSHKNAPGDGSLVQM